jgi:hypothetical protein
MLCCPQFKSKLKTTLLGYMARRSVPEWKVVMDYIEAQKYNRRITSIYIDAFIAQLKTLNEYVDINTVLIGALKRTKNSQETDFIHFTINTLMYWLNEMRPSDDAVIKSMAYDYVIYHMYVAIELGDLAYQHAVRKISWEYSSLIEAFNKLSIKKQRSDSENIFVAKYEQYQQLVTFKIRHIFQDVLMWADNKEGGHAGFGYDVKTNTIKIVCFGMFDNVKKSLSSAPDYKDGKTAEQWARKFLEWRKQNI